MSKSVPGGHLISLIHYDTNHHVFELHSSIYDMLGVVRFGNTTH